MVNEILSGAAVTLLFTDVEGSTRHWESNPTAMREALQRHDTVLEEKIRVNRGTAILERGEGDSAVFSRPADAALAACAIQLALQRERWPTDLPLKVRMAVHTAEVTSDYRGTEVNRCARLRAVAHGGQVLVSSSTAALAAPDLPEEINLSSLGAHGLRDLTQPEWIFQLNHPDLPREFPRLKSIAFRHNLPVQATSFIGREAELEALEKLVCRQPLVTLTGAGGCGKTRLAVQTASEVLSKFEGGCWFVDFAPVADPALVTRATAQALELQEDPEQPLTRVLCDHLRDKQLLLILDNCEHVIETAAELAATLLATASELRILATSREALNIPGETPWPIPSLRLPDLRQLPPVDELLGYEGIRLFCERAAASQPGFALRDDNAEAVAQICTQLDGIPLAIELAAARTNMLGPAEILSRLKDRFRLLTGGRRATLARHQTLRAMVEWSHQLLSEPEQALFRRLAAFAGSFNLPAAEAVCAEEPLEENAVLDLLAHLVDKSLVMAEPEEDGRVRYRLLETLRQYALELLHHMKETDLTQDRHLEYFVGLAERAYTERIDAETAWLARLEAGHDNLRTALAWARQRSPEQYLKLAGALGWFWHLHAHYEEGRRHLEAALALPQEPSTVVARALWSAGTLAGWQGDEEAGRRLTEASRAMSEQLGDRMGVALALESLGWAAFWQGDDETALRSFEEDLRIQIELGNARLIELAKVAVCQVLVAFHRLEEAEPMAQGILQRALQASDPRNTHYGYHFLADCALIREEAETAERLYAESLKATLAYGDMSEATWEVQGVAMAGA